LLGSSDYPVCGSCRELFREALVTRTGKTSCHNCLSVSARRWRCPFCKRHGVPFQFHHVAGREISPVMVVACLNCHAVLTSWQARRKRRLKAQRLDVRDVRSNLMFYGYEDLPRLYRLRNGGEELQQTLPEDYEERLDRGEVVEIEPPWRYYIER
jgi:hypothetical protein